MATDKVIILLLNLEEEGQGSKGSRERGLGGCLGFAGRRSGPTVGLYLGSYGGPRGGGCFLCARYPCRQTELDPWHATTTPTGASQDSGGVVQV